MTRFVDPGFRENEKLITPLSFKKGNMDLFAFLSVSVEEEKRAEQ